MVKNKIKDFINKRIIKNIPNFLTWTRIVACIVAATLFVMGNIPYSIGFYIWGAVSDLLDGFAARKLNAFSEFGRKLDTVSDKLYAGSLLIPSILCGNFIMLIPLAFELGIAGINLKGQRQGIRTETQRIGKIKTVALFPTMIMGLLSTLDPAFLMLLWPMIIVTTNLQYNSIITYNNLLNKKLEEKNNRVEVLVKEDIKDNNVAEKKDKPITPKKIDFKYVCNKGRDLLDECAYYTMYQVPSTTKNNNYGRVLKK